MLCIIIYFILASFNYFFEFSRIINNCIVFFLCSSTLYDDSSNDINNIPSEYVNTGVTVADLLSINVVPLN